MPLLSGWRNDRATFGKNRRRQTGSSSTIWDTSCVGAGERDGEKNRGKNARRRGTGGAQERGSWQRRGAAEGCVPVVFRS